jgi:hypothetical protein
MRDDFNFKIINFPNMCSNIPASPAYGAYILQLIRYARASSNYSDFLKCHLYLRNRLLDQGYKKIRLIRSLKKFIFRYQDIVESDMHFQRNGGLNQILKCQTSRFHYGSKVPAVTITAFITIVEQNRQNNA